MSPSLESRGVKLVVESSPDLFIRVDGGHLKQVLINLVRNGAEAISAGHGHAAGAHRACLAGRARNRGRDSGSGRQRQGHFARSGKASVRPVLQHQGNRHRPGIADCRAHCGKTWRHASVSNSDRSGHDVWSDSAARIPRQRQRCTRAQNQPSPSDSMRM